MSDDEELDDDDILYHVTYANSLDAIANLGLVPGAGSAMGGGGNVGHSLGKVFLSDYDGVSFWFGRSQEWANHYSDDPHGDGMVPVVLRVTVPDWDEVEEDEAGSRDSRKDAWAYKGSINPEFLEVWDGEDWVDLDEDFEDIDVSVAYDEQGYPLDDRDNPLFPEL